ncbi:hypothetical protein [Nonomuraea longicatena]|uniref:Uncharacterized protein n=1 Tax=Nonomuraea longicatena TaxID=83682 RepID=A0ABP4AY27_9ACTN
MRQRLVLYGTLLWSAVYGALGVHWWSGGGGFPFGDPRAETGMSLFTGVTAQAMAPFLAVGCAAGALVAAGALWWRPMPARLVAGFGWVAGPTLLFVLPDVRLLQNLAYALGGHFGLVDWPVLNQLVCVAGGALWAGAALRAAPVRTPSADWRRIGRWATAVAGVAPLPYGIQRAAWSAGIPLGVDEAYVAALLADFDAKGMTGVTAYMLPLACLGGSLLTLGLAQRWGRVFPGRLPLLGGRAVPEALAVVPASLVTVAVTVAGLASWRSSLGTGMAHFATGGVGLLWLPWGLALGLATLAYHHVRRLEGPAGGRALPTYAGRWR